MSQKLTRSFSKRARMRLTMAAMLRETRPPRLLRIQVNAGLLVVAAVITITITITRTITIAIAIAIKGIVIVETKKN